LEEEKRLKGLARRIERVTGPAIKIFYYMGLCCILVMMLITVTDVLLRWLFNTPVLGAYEISEYLMVILVFSALAYTESSGSHVKVDTFYKRFSFHIKVLLDCLTHLFGICIMALIAWTNVKMAYTKWEFGDITGTLPIPVFPMHIIIAIGSILFCLALAINSLHSLAKAFKK
jgi:TRAP-type transport system small permease protein